MRRRFWGWGVILIVGLVLGLVGCSKKDKNPASPSPTLGSISGKVTFKGGLPAAGDTVDVVLMGDQMGPPAAYVQLGDVGTDSTVTYTLSDLTFSTYQSLSVAKLDRTIPFDWVVLGYYKTGSDTISQITISDGNSDLKGIDITAWWH